MPLAHGTKLGPYEIAGPLGVGGMGEVYRARDTRLNRTVAIKIIRQHLSSSTLRERFEREGRAVASLSHPNICTLHDVGHQDGIDYLVMECLEGETLAERLTKGPLPLEQTLRYAIQIAAALDRAHRQGVVHRDLKPANVMLTKDGVKVLDFGLAKLDSEQASPEDTTRSMALTAQGMIMGTLQYMAPEQLEGKPADARSDIFALGTVLYEMTAGRKAFEGGSQASVISAILSSDPPGISTLQPGTPPALEHVVKRCLSKDADLRWQTARDVMLELQWVAQAAPQPRAVVATVPGWQKYRTGLAWSAALLMLGAVVWLAESRFGKSPQPVHVLRMPMLPPPDSSFVSPDLSVSPDGTRLAFVAAGQDGKTALWVRALSASNAQQLNGTEGARCPFWSADSRRIGFFAKGKLRTVDVGSGAVEILSDAQPSRAGGISGAWNSSGTIVFAASVAGPLYRISSSGGAAEPVTRIRQGSGQNHLYPFFLPDGKHFLYTVELSTPEDPQPNGLYVGSLDMSAPKLISAELAGNVVFASGCLIYIRARTLLAQPFDPDRFEITGPPVPVAEGMETATFPWAGFSASQNGVLVFQSVDDLSTRLAWFDEGGKELGQLTEAGYKFPRFSPDGRSLAVSSDDAHDGKYCVRVYDLARGISTRLTDGSRDICPVWSPDGKHITYASSDAKGAYIYDIPADGSGHPQLRFKRAAMIVPNDWSRDGDHLVFMDFGKTRPELAIYSAHDSSVTPFAPESEAQFSPDGKWIAWCGPRGYLPGEIYVQPFPGPGGRLQVSTTGGGQPRWSRDGKQIFYMTADKKLMAVSFDSRKMAASTPRALFQTRIVASAYDFFQYDVALDGRFLINSLPASYAPHLTLLTGWTTLLNAR
ncbi:MAG: protein kinase [Acidobacteriota bacterium]|nr:protein kinase [Acidobacteriota bacterium]